MRAKELSKAGVDTSKHFCVDLSNVPSGSSVTVQMNGVDYTLSESDARVQKAIIDRGYVFNRKTDGRFITAKTFQMLENGWSESVRKNYSHSYQFSMMKDEFERLYRMKLERDNSFKSLSRFFTSDVLVNTMADTIYRAERWFKHEMRKATSEHSDAVEKAKTSKRRKAVKPFKGVAVTTKTSWTTYYDNFTAFEAEVLAPMKNVLRATRCCESTDYLELILSIKNFTKVMVILPDATTKSQEWRDAFKGRGAYTTLLNIIKFHGVRIGDLDLEQGVSYVETYAYNELWRYQELLLDVIEANDFKLTY